MQFLSKFNDKNLELKNQRRSIKFNTRYVQNTLLFFQSYVHLIFFGQCTFIVYLYQNTTKYTVKCLYYSSFDFLWVLHFSVVFLLCRSSPLIFDVFPSVSVCYPDLLFSQLIYKFRTAVYYCHLYLCGLLSYGIC